jgi:hypothetical protein
MQRITGVNLPIWSFPMGLKGFAPILPSWPLDVITTELSFVLVLCNSIELLGLSDFFLLTDMTEMQGRTLPMTFGDVHLCGSDVSQLLLYVYTGWGPKQVRTALPLLHVAEYLVFSNFRLLVCPV